MIRTLALLCLATPAFSLFTDLEKGLAIRYDVNPIAKWTGKSFIKLPQSKDSAMDEGWTQEPRPDAHAEYASLEMWCEKCNTICLLFDDTGYIAGIQMALNTEQFTDALYDWKTQGFWDWSRTDENGKTEKFKVTYIYFSSPEFLQTSAEARKAARDSTNTLLPDKFIYVSGINGKLHPIPTNVTDLANAATSNFTLQNCMPWMGNHYYYEMTEKLECNDELFPYFPLEFKGSLIGIGYVGYGKYSTKAGCTDYFENPDKTAVKIIVPRGPECLYNLADKPGLITMHTYFIKDPTKMWCIPDLF